MALAGSLPVHAQNVTFEEYKVKAAFVFNFIKYMEWSPRKLESVTSPIVIGVLRPNPFGRELEDLVKGRPVNSRPVVVREFATIAAARAAHILFVSASAENSMGASPRELIEHGVLTIGESKSFARSGGILVFTFEGDNLVFEIDQGIAEKAELKISAKLYNLARSVRK
jgi:hypothetical protein